MKRKSRPLAQAGFTLIELLVSLIIVAVLLAISLPGFERLSTRYQMRTIALQLHSAMEYARVESIIRGAPVELCPRAPEPGVCGEDYRQGWVVRVASPGASELLRISDFLASGISVSNRQSSRPLHDAVRWRPDGSANRNVSFQLCAKGVSGSDAFVVVLSRAGRSRVARGEGLCPGEAA
ncbi:hypothetical protein A3709_11525 [Halioglobus sp. HI00S01]|uniref:GspH/FimT family pseudopilin n=2 Tax=Halioglobus sp. HI00S01 TaxID=1822214 RepID=UPI0007C23E01|nr:GspH/FimT family pseudopilin [Halioglobus sp. HI00S01]KZX50375.1 hypothetical protein A3709_11525 [Halioglobus sp. HI00S01]